MKNNRLGMILVVSSLAVITVIVGLLLQRQRTDDAAQLRMQGLGLVRSLATLPVAMLAPPPGQPGVLNSVLALHDHPDFAYAAVTGANGRNLAEAASPGTVVPPGTAMPALAGFAERPLAAGDNSRAIREFYGPLASVDGSPLQLRIGYFQPRSWFSVKDLPFYALIALAVFLLVPLCYLVFKRELAPLAAIGAQLRELQTTQGQAVAPADQDVRDLATKLNSYLDQASTRIRELEHDSITFIANGRLLEYGSSKMQAVLQCLPDGLLVLDPAGDVTFASGKVEPLLGVPVSDVLSQPVEAWCRDADLRAMLQRFRGGGDQRSQVTIEFNPVNVPDKRLWATAQSLQGDVKGMNFGTLVVLRDATREHLARQAGNDFVAHVAHELKSPLNVIGMYGEMLADAGAGPEEEALRVEAVNVIQDEVERMTGLVSNLLNVSKLEMGAMRPDRHRVKLDDLLRDVYQHARTRAEAKGIRLDMQVPRDIAAVAVDKDLFRISLNNLLNNAIKYNQAGGTVVLSAEEEGSDVVISVRDSGIGMAAADQARVMEKFYRVAESGEQARGGHGLGLYLAKQIVELHHGQLTLESELGHGSTFAIHLNKMPALVEGANVL